MIPRSKKMPWRDQCLGTPHVAESCREAIGPCKYSSQSAEKSCGAAPSKLTGQERGFQPTTLYLLSLGGYQAQDDEVLRFWFCWKGRDDLHWWFQNFLYPLFFFFLTCCGLTAHRVGAPASAKKWSWRQIGISFQLLLFTDLFKDKTMTQQWFCAYMENTPAFLQKEGLWQWCFAWANTRNTQHKIRTPTYKSPA